MWTSNMKNFLIVCSLFCFASFVQSDFIDDIVDSLAKYFDEPESESEARDFDMGDGFVLGLRNYEDLKARLPAKEFNRRIKEEGSFTDKDGDYIGHNCTAIKPYEKKYWFKEEWNVGFSRRKFRGPMTRPGKKDRRFTRYNSAYGIPMIGTVNFTDDAMIRGCYLIRYLFADNPHLRIRIRRKGMFFLGYRGGRCCPPQAGNMGTTCQCDNIFPLKAKGAPAHEFAHYFIKYPMNYLVKQGLIKFPKYVNQDGAWEYQKVFSEGDDVKCENAEGMAKKYEELMTWNWNAQKNDRARGRTKVEQCKLHHYLIYAGQQNWLFKGNQKVIDKSRPCMKKKSENMYNFMEKIWPCNNIYIPVCKDAAYNFKLGLAHSFTIGKQHPDDPSVTVCEKGIDVPEITADQVPPIEQPKEDGASRTQCMDVARRVDKKAAAKAEASLPEVNAWAKYLRDDHEYPWYLRRCCAKTFNFDNSVPQNVEEDENYEVSDITCKQVEEGELFDADDEETMNANDFDSTGGGDKTEFSEDSEE